MRKILLGTTAVIGAALLAPTMAAAQEAPTVRVGGYFRAYYGNTNQTNNLSINTPQNTIGAGDTRPAGALQAPNGATSNGNELVPQSARLGHNDFSTDAEIHVFVNGKTANGLTYGAVVEIQFDSAEGSSRNARRAVVSKTTAAIDEMYAFVASPTLGQIRFGDEDGPFGGLMNAGFVTNFGSGGVYGDWESFVVRPNRTTTSPGGVGDNTKIIYLSPQFFGFDFGVSWAFNEGEGEDTGCLNSFASINCDRAYAVTGNNGFARSHDMPGRLNELQAMARWRGNVGPLGIAASFGTMQSSVIRLANATTGEITKNLRSPQVYQGGIQATAYGFTVGGAYMWGNTSFFYIPTARGDKDMEQFFVGGSYTMGPITVGANSFWGTYGSTGGVPGRGQRRWAVGVGANYRLAPGLDLIAEWVHHEVKQPGVIPAGTTSDRARASVFLTGVRLAF